MPNFIKRNKTRAVIYDMDGTRTEYTETFKDSILNIILNIDYRLYLLRCSIRDARLRKKKQQ